MEYRRPVAADFEKIFELQNQNLASTLSQAEKTSGFLSVPFTANQFQAMDKDMCVVVCAEVEKIIGYICASSIEFNKQVPVIAHMLKQFSQINYKNKTLSDFQSFIYGPVCVD